MHSLIILSKAQINQVQDVSQKVTLHRPNTITKRWMTCSNIMEIAPDSLMRYASGVHFIARA